MIKRLIKLTLSTTPITSSDPQYLIDLGMPEDLAKAETPRPDEVRNLLAAAKLEWLEKLHEVEGEKEVMFFRLRRKSSLLFRALNDLKDDGIILNWQEIKIKVNEK